MSTLLDGASPTASIIADVLGLYSGGRRATDRVRRLYNADATFEDGIMAVKGVSSVAAQFSALSAVFSTVTITAKAPPILTFADRPTTRHGGPPQIPATITLLTTQAFTTRGIPVTLTIEADIHLELDPASGRIIKHHDKWHGVVDLPAFLRVRRLPLVSPPRPLRAVNGFLSTTLLRLAGYGKTGQEAPAATTTGRTHQE